MFSKTKLMLAAPMVVASMTSPAFALAGGNFDRTPPRPSADSTQQSRIWQGADWHWTPAWESRR